MIKYNRRISRNVILFLFLGVSVINQIKAQSGSALKFEQSNDEGVVITDDPTLDITGDLTISQWVYHSNWSNAKGRLFHKDNAYTLYIYDGDETIRFYNYNTGKNGGGTKHDLSGSGWHHVAATYDKSAGEVKIYIDGLYKGKNSIGSPLGQSPVDVHIGIDEDKTSYAINGKIDETRLWKKKLTKTEIRDNMCETLTGNETDLVSYWEYDNGSGNTLTDKTNNNNDGTLIGNSTNTPAWQTSEVPLGDYSTYNYTSTWSNTSVARGNLTGDQLKVDQISGSPTPPDGIFVIQVDDAPNNMNGNGNIVQVSQEMYFIVHSIGGSPMYDVTYQFTSHPGYNNLSDLVFGKRSDNASGAWDEKKPNNYDTGSRPYSIKLKNQTGSEYILASKSTSNSLPVELTHFNAEWVKASIELSWATASETNNSHFRIQRRNEGNWENIGKVNGNGTTTTPQDYSFIDQHPQQGTNYYRLKQVDFDGSFEYSGIRTASFENTSENGKISIKVLTNPVRNYLRLNIQNPMSQRIPYQLINIQGHVFRKGEWFLGKGNHNVQIAMVDVEQGTYFLEMQGENQVITKKIIK